MKIWIPHIEKWAFQLVEHNSLTFINDKVFASKTKSIFISFLKSVIQFERCSSTDIIRSLLLRLIRWEERCCKFCNRMWLRVVLTGLDRKQRTPLRLGIHHLLELRFHRLIYHELTSPSPDLQQLESTLWSVIVTYMPYQAV